MKVNKYAVTIELISEQLGTNPAGLDVMDKHIIDRQRKLIAENSSVNKAINKYLGAKDISDEKARMELDALRRRVEELMGRELTEEEYETLKEGDLKKLKDLKETIIELDEKGITCFFRGEPREDGTQPILIGSHMIHGFLKAAVKSLALSRPTKKGKFGYSANYSIELINHHVRILPEMIEASKDIERKEDGSPKYLQRSLRAMTAQGPRISLAKSEVLPLGTQYSFIINVLDGSQIGKEELRELLEYGEIFFGIGQWRNSGKGMFKIVNFEEVE